MKVNIIDDSENEANESFFITLSPVAGSKLGVNTQFTVTISDDDSNTAPTVTLTENSEVNTGATVNVTATVSDNESDPMTYLWQQTAGTNITLTNATALAASFVAPSSAGDITLSFTATDSKGLSTSKSLTLTVVAAPVVLPPPPVENESSGSGSIGYFILFMIIVLSRKRLKVT